NLDGEELGALVIDAVGQQPVVGAVRDAAELPIGVAFGFAVAIKQDRLGAAAARTPADPGILPAGDVARGGLAGGVRSGRRAVVFLDAGLHFGEQRILPVERVAQRFLGEGVLRLQVGADLG